MFTTFWKRMTKFKYHILFEEKPAFKLRFHPNVFCGFYSQLWMIHNDAIEGDQQIQPPESKADRALHVQMVTVTVERGDEENTFSSIRTLLHLISQEFSVLFVLGILLILMSSW